MLNNTFLFHFQMRNLSRPANLCFFLLILIIVLVALSSAYPSRFRGKRSPRRRTDYTANYNYAVSRPANCALDDELYTDCYWCGKLSDNSQVYRQCCAGNEVVFEFCSSLLSWDLTLTSALFHLDHPLVQWISLHPEFMLRSWLGQVFAALPRPWLLLFRVLE